MDSHRKQLEIMSVADQIWVTLQRLGPCRARDIANVLIGEEPAPYLTNMLAKGLVKRDRNVPSTFGHAWIWSVVGEELPSAYTFRKARERKAARASDPCPRCRGKGTRR